MKTRVGLSLDTELLADVDAEKGRMTRTAWIEEAMEEKLARDRAQGVKRSQARRQHGVASHAAAKAGTAPIPKK